MSHGTPAAVRHDPIQTIATCPCGHINAACSVSMDDEKETMESQYMFNEAEITLCISPRDFSLKCSRCLKPITLTPVEIN